MPSFKKCGLNTPHIAHMWNEGGIVLRQCPGRRSKTYKDKPSIKVQKG